MGPPAAEPVGLQLARTAKAVSRAFDEALGEVGGTLPTWLILMSLKASRHGAQRDIAAAIGVEGPTLTHHLNRLEDQGLVRRSRDPDNRRAHRVALTEAGDAAFGRMLGAVQSFDRRLRSGLTKPQLTELERALAALRGAVGS
ncbi:MAG TPA: MarR family winged helix-turn-helix transcriptional regulator [Jatrophihabitans sp.]|nr:MarR family winged helix-turn-helix transcriptional regulator [Jatrophihabitans sp.]